MSGYRRAVGMVSVWLLLGATMAVASGLARVDVKALPSDPAVNAAYAAVAAVESMAAEWQPHWRYPTPKSQVAAKLGTALHHLRASAQKYPNNEELQLLIGVAGTLAHNVDVPGAFDTAAAALTRAGQLAATDMRPEMLLGELDCSAPDTMAKGMELFLDDERQHSVSALPSEFWSAYLSCAALTGMLAHARRAAKQLEAAGRLDASLGALETAAEKQIAPTDPVRNYTASQTWRMNKSASTVQFYSTACGLGITVPGVWGAQIAGITHGTCEAVFTAAVGAETPVILVLAQAPRPGQTLAAFAAQHNAASSTMPVVGCPASACLGFRARMVFDGKPADLYTTVFKGLAPPNPGLRFERPLTFPNTSSTAPGPVYYVPPTVQARLAPTLYYFVSMLTPESGKNTALDTYKAFLSKLELDAANAAMPRAGAPH